MLQTIFTRVDLHRLKILVIQTHTLSQGINTNHTNFRHFAKMVSSNSQRIFFMFCLKSRCIVLIKKENMEII